MEKRIVVLFLVTALLFSLMNQNLSAQVAEQDSLALVALYNSTDGANWTDNTNWNSGPVYSWYGINVSSGRVTRVDLDRNNLVGTIPVEIGNLSNLTLLSLHNNQLSDSIPSEIGNLTNLEVVNLNSNQLSDEIPNTIGNLSNIYELYLQDNQFSGSVPDSLVNLILMHRLYIYDNQLTDLPDLSSITALSDLLIQNNHFTFEDIESNMGVASFGYAPQDSVGEKQDTILSQGSGLVISISLGGTANQYQWIKDGIDISGADSSSYSISSAAASDSGVYSCRITNTIATELTLYSRPVHVMVSEESGISDQLHSIPKGFVLHQNYPNPFNPTTIITFHVPILSHVTIRVYNILGEVVRNLAESRFEAGLHRITWQGKDNAGIEVESGVYFYRMESENIVDTKKLLFLK